MEKIYSNKLIHSYLRFLEKNYGRELTERILADVGTDRTALADLNDFQTAEFSVRICESAARHTGQENTTYLAGRSIIETLGRVEGMVMGFTSPSLCMRLLSKVESTLALKTITKVTPAGKNRFLVRVSFRDGFQEHRYICLNRIGCYEAIPTIFGLPFAKVEHPNCVFKGAAQCEYVVTLPEYRFIVLKKIGIALLMVGVFLGAWSLAGKAGAIPDWAAIASLFLGLGAYAAFKHRLAARSVEWNLQATEGLTSQNRELEKNIVRMDALQDLTLVMVQAHRMHDVCDLATTALRDKFEYASSQIWMLDESRSLLALRSAAGYTTEQSAWLEAPPDAGGRDPNPSRFMRQVMEERKTVVVDNAERALESMPPEAAAFYAALDPSSWVATPLYQNDVPIGVLAAERRGKAKVEQKDRILFQSIANIVANAMVRAELFEGMERKIVQRTRELEAKSRQLLSAKEMAIQSEKLSALGQMAAGVAHEINNPLNFLVNVMPDMRRDMECMEKIRTLFHRTVQDESAKAKALEMEAEYDLASHLSEKEFVFDNIKLALDKSTLISNSLKVFSRSADREAISRESFSSIIHSVMDLIPQKHKGNTAIHLDVPPEAGWMVNRNEMEQVVLCLIKNAIEAMDYGGRLDIEGWERDDEAGLRFRDSGPGIPEEALNRIFEPFYTTKPPGMGTGLGLTIAMEIVKKLGGVLEAASEAGRGAIFTIRFGAATQSPVLY